MGKFNLSKGEEEQKTSKFNLSKSEDFLAEEQKSSKFNLGKSDAAPAEESKSDKFNLSKAEDGSVEASKSSKFNLGKSENASAESTDSGKSNFVADKVIPVEESKPAADKDAKSSQNDAGKSKADKAVPSVRGNEQTSNKKDANTPKVGTTSGSGTATTSTNTSDNGKKHTGLWILLAALVVVGVIVATVLYKNHKDDNNNNEVQTEQVEQVVNTPEEETVTEETTVSEEAETLEETATEDTPAQAVTPTQPAQSKPQATSITNASNNRGTLSGDLEQDAKAVIRGDFGNYPERKAAIEALGGNYREIQNKVNEIYNAKGL